MTFIQTNTFSARFFALLLLVSMLLSAVPASVFVALAADTLHSTASVTVDNTAEFATGAIDASGHTNLELSFDFDASSLDATAVQDSFTYGWRSVGGSNNVINSFLGLSGNDPTEVSSVAVPLPLGAQISDLEIFISVSSNGSSPADDVIVTNLTVTGDLPACTPQYDVAGPTDIQNITTGDYFNTVQDAIDDCDTVNGNTILLSDSVVTSAQVTIDKEITLDGGNNTLFATFVKTTNDNNSAIGIIGTDNVTVQNITLDGTGGTNLHGLNVYESTGIVVTNVHSMNFRSGMVVNGSTVDATDFTTSGNIWHGINVAPGSGVTTPSILNISATSEHAEERLVLPHIFTDDVTAGTIEVNDLDNQYEMFEFGNARAYWLKRIASLEITNPATDGEVFPPMVMTFEADYTDDDDTEDTINWAIKPGSCEANDPNVNLLGFGTPGYAPATYNALTGEIEVTADLSSFADGDYCFVVNPAETGGETDTEREVRLFTIETPPTVCHLPYIVEFDEVSDEAVFSTTPGTGLVIEEVPGGYTIGLYDDGRVGVYRVKGTITFPDGTDTATFAFSEASGDDGLEQTHATYPDVADRSGTTIDFDLFVNGADDIFTVTNEVLENEANCEVVFPPLPEASLIITDPIADGEVLTGSHTFLGEYVDADETFDAMRWAIRAGTCAASTGTVAGNVDGFSDSFSWDGADFSTTVNMSLWADGEYCLVLNPDESGDGEDFRATRLFTIDNPEPAVCMPMVNVLENPSFEEPVVTASKGWDILSPIAWLVEKVSDSSAVGMELQSTVNGWSHSDGAQHTELAGNEANITSQTVPTVPGETYTLTWDYSPRPGKSFAENKMEVYVDGVEVEQNQTTGIGLSDTAWESYEYVFTASGSSVEVAFKDAGDSNGTGPMLDNTSLICGELDDELYLIDGYKFNDDGNGYWDEWEYGLEGWTIEITNGETTMSTTTDEYGYYYFVVTDEGEWVVSEVQQYGWEQTAPMMYPTLYSFTSEDPEMVDESPYYPGVCTIEVGEPWFDEELEFVTFISEEPEFDYEYEYSCDFGNMYIAETVDGFKWNDIDGNGIWNKDEETMAGWTIEITNGETTFSTTTDEGGYYYFEVEPGTWTVSEVQQSGWTQTAPTEPNTCEFEVYGYEDVYKVSEISEGPDYSCYFGNQYEGTTNTDASLRCYLTADDIEVRRGDDVTLTWTTFGATDVSIDNELGTVASTGSMTINLDDDTLFTLTASNGEESINCEVFVDTVSASGGSSLSSRSGQVLGASTSEPEGQVAGAQCSMYLQDYMRLGMNNSLEQVVKLQSFLRGEGHTNLITGTFDQATDSSVRAFQTTYASEILQPWADLGLGDGSPTGYVFKTTRWKINNIVCPGSEAMPELP